MRTARPAAVSAHQLAPDINGRCAMEEVANSSPVAMEEVANSSPIARCCNACCCPCLYDWAVVYTCLKVFVAFGVIPGFSGFFPLLSGADGCPNSAFFFGNNGCKEITQGLLSTLMGAPCPAWREDMWLNVPNGIAAVLYLVVRVRRSVRRCRMPIIAPDDTALKSVSPFTWKSLSTCQRVLVMLALTAAVFFLVLLIVYIISPTYRDFYASLQACVPLEHCDLTHHGLW